MAVKAEESNFYATAFVPSLHKIIIPHKFIKECFCCNRLFDNENKPFQIKCGHSVCPECIEDYVETSLFCSKCSLIILNTRDAIENRCLWEQIIRLNNEKALKELIEIREQQASWDPMLKLSKYLHDVAHHISWLKMILDDFTTYLSEFQRYENVTKKYIKMIKEFGDEQKELSVKEALENLSAKIGTVEGTLKKFTNFEEICVKVNGIKNLFFNIFKNVEIQYDEKTLYSLLDTGHNVYVLSNLSEKKVLFAKFTKEEIGTHLHSCEAGNVPDTGLFYFWCNNFYNKELETPSYIFFDLEANISKQKKSIPIKVTKRIYISFSKECYERVLMDFFIGLNGNFRNKHLKNNGESYGGDLPDTPGWIKDNAYLTKNDEVGLVSLRLKGNSVRMIITLTCGPAEEQVNNVIGKLVSGLKFLENFNNCVIKDHGVCFSPPLVK